MVNSLRCLLLATVLGSFAAQCHAGTCGPAYGADGIAEDESGNVWFTHYEDVRISTFSAATGKFAEYLPTTRANPEVTTRKKGSASRVKFDYSYDTGFTGIGLDNARKYFWTFRWNSSTLTRFSLQDRQFKDFEFPGRAYARGTILIDGHGHLWILTTTPDKDFNPTNSRVVEVSPDGKILRQIPLPHSTFYSYALALDNQGKLWLAQSGMERNARTELYVLDGDRFVKRNVSGLGRIVSSMAFDAANNLWLTNHDEKTLTKYDGGKLTTEHLPEGSGAPGGAIADGRGNLWFTEHLGDGKPGKIGRRSAGGKISEYSVPAEEDWIVTMTPAKDGGIWFSTILNYNLFHLDPVTGKIREYAVPVPTNWSEDAAARSATCTIKNKDAIMPPAASAAPVLRHPKGYADNKLAVLFEKSCTHCHSWYRVDKVAARRSDWTATVDRMIYANGGKQFITSAERELIISYLNNNYSAKTLRQ